MKNPENLDFIRSLLKPGVMTLDRKKKVIQEFVDFVDSKKSKKIRYGEQSLMRRYILERIYHYSTYLTSWSWQKLYGDKTKRGEK